MSPVPAQGGPSRPRPGRLFGLRLIKRYRRSDDGATAVEFAFVSVPFFALLFAILETALVFWTTQVLETAVTDASRLIYTGQFQSEHRASTAEEMAAAFREEICARVVALISCSTMLEVDVRAFASFESVALDPLIDAEGAFASDGFRFETSGERQVVVVRAAVEYPVFVTLLDASRANLANGRRLIVASAAFRNEPFGQ